MSKPFHETLNDYRVFPRLFYSIILFMAVYFLQWILGMIEAGNISDQVQVVLLPSIAAVILGAAAKGGDYYANSGGKT